jgi:wyosine [tRNA(Phe)-imidazoG37] synthetase (radical SAM superfamily)
MLIKDINDTRQDINKLKEVVEKIVPDRIHLNTVVRPPSEKYALPLSTEELQKVKHILGDNAEIIASTKTKREPAYIIDIEKTIFDIIKRRPVTLDDIFSVTDLHRNEILKYLDQLQQNKKIRLTKHDNRNYYEAILQEVQ